MNAQRVWDANVEGVVHVTSPTMVHVTAEEYKSIPVFNTKAGGWVRGAQLRGVKVRNVPARLCSTPGGPP